MMLSKRIYIVAILFAALVAGCGGIRPIPGIEERDTKLPPLPPRDSMDPRAYTYYTNGTLLELMGNMPMANRQYEEALKIYPGSSEIKYAYAATFLAMNDYPRSLREAKKISPRDLRVWLLVGDCFRAIGNNDSAMAAFGTSLKFDSNNAAVYNFMGAYYQQINNFDSAIWAYKNIARIAPSYQIYQEIANFHMRARKLDEARKYYTMSIALDSSASNTRSYLGLSAIFEALGDIPGAKKYLETAASLSPQNTFILSRLLGFYQDTHEYDKALGSARALIALTPDDKNAVRRLGVLYHDADSLKPADSIFKSLLKDGDENIVNYYYLGRIAFEQNNYSDAKNDFLKMTIMGDSVVDGWLNLGLTYQMQDSSSPEIAAFEEGLRHLRNLDDSIRVMFALAAAVQRNNEFDRSVALFEKIIALSPNHAQSLNYLGYMLAEKKVRLDYATDLIKHALEIAPDNGAYIDSYGWVLYQKGDYQNALKELLRACATSNDDPAILEHVGDAYKAIGDTVNAQLYWQKALNGNSDDKSLKEKLGK